MIDPVPSKPQITGNNPPPIATWSTRFHGLPTWKQLGAARLPFGRLASYLRPQRSSIALTVLLGIAAGLSTLPLLSAWRFVIAAMLGDSWVAESLWPAWPRPVAYAALCAPLPVLILARGGLIYLHELGMLRAGNGILHGLRDDLFANLMRQGVSFYQRSKTGELIQLLFNQTRLAQAGAIRVWSDGLVHGSSIVCLAGFLLVHDWRYALGGFLVYPVCLLPMLLVRERVHQAANREEEDSAAQVMAAQEVLSGIRAVKTYAQEESERERFLQADLRTLAHADEWHRAAGMAAPLIAAVAVAGVATGLVYAKLTGMSPAQFLILNTAVAALYPHIRAFSQLGPHLDSSLAACAKVFSWIDREPEVRDAPGAITLCEPRGELTLTDVHFRYPGAQEDAIQGCNAAFRPGRVHALVGWPGSGKSTLLSLLLRFHDPRSGSITLDGIDLRQITQRSLREHVSVVNQDVLLFRDTIHNNILYGRPGASREEVIAAAQRAFAHDFILETPGGYDAIVGEPGATFSGGRQQRIALARIFLRNTPILLLDDTYFSLDPESEGKIQAAIEDLSQGKTVVANPHRGATLLSADEIYVLDGGRIIDSGRHDDLMARCEVYQQLFERHFRARDLATPATMATM
jgi:subfamily B ATP-binding cassette protein MsbA